MMVNMAETVESGESGGVLVHGPGAIYLTPRRRDTRDAGDARDAEEHRMRSPSEALATAHLALQQWSALAEKPHMSVEIRDGVRDAGRDDVRYHYDDADDGNAEDGGHQSRDSPSPNSESKGPLVWTVLSLQYAKFLMVLGLTLPVSGVLVSDTSPQAFEAFYVYLYLVSLLFMTFMYTASAWRHRRKVTVQRTRGSRGMRYRLKLLRQSRAQETVRYGSVYLRLAMNAFGIGNMVYCCLEVAHGIVKYQKDNCAQMEQQVKILLPAFRAILTLAQMHFMLFNNKAAEIRRHRCISRIGLAHMIATNICEWLSVVVEETRHEIAELGSGGHILAVQDDLGDLAGNFSVLSNSTGPGACESPSESPEQDVIGNLLKSSGPFLFPCTIEYSLICAVILFEMWKHAGKSEDEGSASRLGSRVDLSSDSRSSRVVDTDDDTDSPSKNHQTLSTITGTTGNSSMPWRTAHHLSVDLTHSQRGMFLGILLVVVTIMALVLFFALGETEVFQRDAHILVSYMEGSLHVAVILAVALAAFAMRRLGQDQVPYHPLPLDIFLLFVAQVGAYLYSVFSIVGAYVLLTNSQDSPARAVDALRILLVEVLSVLHAGVQTHFILRAWHMRCVGERQWSDKPGREHVTFLIHANVCMWLVATFCKSRAQYRPLHLNLFGVWPWTVLTHVSIPLTIFLHFHSSICLFEVWKNTYKFRPD